MQDQIRLVRTGDVYSISHSDRRVAAQRLGALATGRSLDEQLASIRVEVVFLCECAGHRSASRECPLCAAGLPVRLQRAPLDLWSRWLAELHGDAADPP